MAESHAVFGFDVECPFPLRTARVSGGSDRLIVEVGESDDIAVGSPLLKWTPRPENPVEASLAEHPDGGYFLRIAEAGTYVIRPELGAITAPVMPDVPLREARLLGLPLLLCFLARGEASLHGAAVMGPTGAIVLAAPGRHGKTSLAATMAILGHRLLTEDLCCIGTDSEVLLYPGPASLRVRPDMASHLLPMPGMREVGVMDERVVLAASDPGGGEAVPITAVVMLKGFEDSGSLRQVDSLGSLSNLWMLSFHLPTEEDRARKFSQLVDLVEAVPVWELTQPNDPSQIRSTAELLLSEVCR